MSDYKYRSIVYLYNVDIRPLPDGITAFPRFDPRYLRRLSCVDEYIPAAP